MAMTRVCLGVSMSPRCKNVFASNWRSGHLAIWPFGQNAFWRQRQHGSENHLMQRESYRSGDHCACVHATHEKVSWPHGDVAMTPSPAGESEPREKIPDCAHASHHPKLRVKLRFWRSGYWRTMID